MRLRTVVFAAVPSAALWVLLVGSLTWHELEVGLFVTGLVCGTLFLLHRSYPESIRLRWSDLQPLWRVLFTVLHDTVTVSTALLRDLLGAKPVPSLYRTVRWEQRSDKLLERGRGVLATIAMTASPNTIVIGIDPEQSRMVLHQVQREPVDSTARALGAKP